MENSDESHIPNLSHLDAEGHARMVDVSAKAVTVRTATAYAAVRVGPVVLRALRDRTVPKGDVLAVAQIAGIQAAKRTGELIPLCHPLPLDNVVVRLRLLEAEEAVEIVARAKTAARTGVEMEALTAASVAALTVYDMCKALDKGLEIGPVYLLEKTGGKSGTYRRDGGTVVSLNVSARRTVRKTPVPAADFVAGHGITGDAHAGPWHRQVSLLAWESIQKMQSKGLQVKAGDFAENVTIQGLDVMHLPVGTRLLLGEAVELEVTQIGKECHTRCAIYQQAGDCVMPREGVFARVLTGGRVQVGDSALVLCRPRGSGLAPAGTGPGGSSPSGAGSPATPKDSEGVEAI